MKTHKILACFLAFVVTFAFFLGTGGLRDAIGTPYIRVASASQEQEEILDLFARAGKEILVFDYHTRNQFTQVEVWVEIYHYGELIERRGGISMGGEPLGSGQFFVMRDHGMWGAMPQAFQWTFFTEHATFQDQSWTMEYEGILGRAWGPIEHSRPIADGEEIVLHATRFSADNLRAFHDLQRYLIAENREDLTYLHLIVARFST